MRKLILTALTAAIAVTASASPLWMRYNTISPKGDKVAFSYKGDIYVVNSNGGEAKQLTTSPSYEFTPIFSPDGSKVAFASDRNGNFDIYVVSTEGGVAQRVTTNSAIETPMAFSKDGKSIIYTANIQKPAENVQFNSGWITELYSIAVEGGRPTQILSNAVMNIALDTDGKSFLYENRTGSENNWRKHHVSSVARDIYHFDAATNTHKQLTTNVGEDRNPQYTPDGKVVFLSERDGGSFNVYVADKGSMDNAKAVTSFKGNPVRFLSMAQDGTMCYGYQGEIYTQKLGGKPAKLAISFKNDIPTEQMTQLAIRGGSMSMTPEGSQIVFVSRGEVFATTDKYATTKRITNTPEAEAGAVISPDGRTIAYASERDGQWNIYTAKMAREEEVNFAHATIINEEPLFTPSKTERIAPQFSPDGKEIAFLENRRVLKVMNLETKKIRQITDGSKHVTNSSEGFDYQWSPDGKWFTMAITTNQRAPYDDIAIISAVDGGEFHNITNSGYTDGSPRWVLDGNAILYASERYGMRSHASWGSQNDVFIAFLNKDAYDEFRLSKEDYDLLKEEEKLAKKIAGTEDKEDKKEAKEDKKDIVVELEGLEDRVIRLTPMSSNLASAALSKDGSKLYFLASFESGADLWEMDVKGRSTKIIKKGAGYGDLQLSKDGKTLYMLGGRAQKMNLASKATTSIPASTTMTYDAAAEREYMFNHVFLQQTKRFYNPNYHGVDLVALKKAYAPFLAHINNNYDFSELLSEILGELNVSHTGSGYRVPFKSTDDATADFGLLYDLNYNGDGLKVAEVLKNGPFDKEYSKVAAGDIVEKIDGVAIKAGEDYFSMLNKKSGIKTLVSLYNPTTNERWDEVVKPVTKGALSGAMYDRWVKSRAEEVKRLSKGRLGYVHIASMNDGSYRVIYADIMGRYNNLDGVVIDTRFNGGGRLHEDIEILFSGEKYLETLVRDELYATMPSRRYIKPSIMLTCEANYSNAHGTPWVYKHKGIGSLVGMPVPGTMTSVNWETLQDPTIYFGIPVVGYKTKEGYYLENFQLEPDFKVVNTPESLDKGQDKQLEVAVKELLKQIDANPSW